MIRCEYRTKTGGHWSPWRNWHPAIWHDAGLARVRAMLVARPGIDDAELRGWIVS